MRKQFFGNFSPQPTATVESKGSNFSTFINNSSIDVAAYGTSSAASSGIIAGAG